MGLGRWLSAIKLVENKAQLPFPLVYRIIELALILPVAMTSVERVFLAMNIIKTDLRNRTMMNGSRT
jgi:hypothetical protein